MNVVKQDVLKLIDKELENANKQFPLFQSEHEGYAVLLEEEEELCEDTMYIESLQFELWDNIKSNGDLYKMLATVAKIRLKAVDAACEAIQVAAMCNKFITSLQDKDN